MPKEEVPKANIESSTDFLNGKLMGSYTFHNNLGEKIGINSESKIRICLMNYLQNLKERGGWLTPFGILITILITLSTTEFQDKFSIPKYTWQALFIMGGFICLAWLLRELFKRPKEITIDKIIEELIPPLEDKKIPKKLNK